MCHCYTVPFWHQIEVHPAYAFTTDEWFRLPEAERIIIIEERTRYKKSRGNNDKIVVSEITTGGVQDNIRSIQQRISAIESNTGDGQSRASGSIIGGRNEQANMRSSNNGNDRSVLAVNVKRIKTQVTTGGYDIKEPEPGNISVNEIDTNSDTCCFGSNFTVLKMTSRTLGVYPYDPSCKPFYNVSLVSGATTVTDIITGNLFIVVKNEALYYGKKLDHSLINPNQLICSETMVWGKPFDPF